MMNRREADSLDRYITGNYGEDQFRDETPLEDTFSFTDEWLMRIAHHIYDAWDVGVIDFATAEESMNTLNSLAEDVVIGLPG